MMDVRVPRARLIPSEMPLFTRGLAERRGAGDRRRRPARRRPARTIAREALTDYMQIDTGSTRTQPWRRCCARCKGRNVDLVETLWEPTGASPPPGSARRSACPGSTCDQAMPFRDKGLMKERVEAAGIRTPRSVRATTVDGCRGAAAAIGYPIIIKPISGAGSMDTYRIEDDGELEAALARLGSVPEVSVEEFIDGEEFTYDTICAAGSIAFENICEYRPRPLVGKQVEWISQQIFALARPRRPRPGRRPADGSRRHRGDGLHAAGSRTWSGTARRPARSCSARSGRAPRAPGSPT